MQNAGRRGALRWRRSWIAWKNIRVDVIRNGAFATRQPVATAPVTERLASILDESGTALVMTRRRFLDTQLEGKGKLDVQQRSFRATSGVWDGFRAVQANLGMQGLRLPSD